MRKSNIVAVFAVAAALALPATAQVGGVVVERAPGAVGVAQTIDVTATITAVDAASRAVRLKGPDGKEVSVIAGPEVKNFDQLQAGDKVNVKYVEALIVELKKGGGAPVARTEQAGVATAKPGEKPAALGGRQVTVVGDVVDLDPSTQYVTVRGPERTVDLKVRDPEQFKLISKGDQLQATYTEAAAISVTKQ